MSTRQLFGMANLLENIDIFVKFFSCRSVYFEYHITFPVKEITSYARVLLLKFASVKEIKTLSEMR